MTNHQNVSCNTRNRVVIPGGCGRVGVFFTADTLPVNKIARPDNTELLSGLELLSKKAGF